MQTFKNGSKADFTSFYRWKHWSIVFYFYLLIRKQPWQDYSNSDITLNATTNDGQFLLGAIWTYMCLPFSVVFVCDSGLTFSAYSICQEVSSALCGDYRPRCGLHGRGGVRLWALGSGWPRLLLGWWNSQLRTDRSQGWKGCTGWWWGEQCWE